VLEGLGWRLHRIWSTDWIYDRSQETDRLREAVDQAVREGPRPVNVPMAAEPSLAAAESTGSTGPAAPEAASIESTPSLPRTEPTPRQASPDAGEGLDTPGSPVVPYRRAEVRMVSSDPDDLYDPANARHVHDLMVQVLEIEAPVHVDELACRVATAFSAQRVTGRVGRRVSEVLEHVLGYEVLDDFVWAQGSDRGAYATVRVGGERDLEMLPAEEIAAAAAWTLSQAFSMPSSDLVRDTARMFGIQRLGVKVEARMREGVELLVSRGTAAEDGHA